MTDLRDLLDGLLEEQPALSITRETALASGRRAVRRRRRTLTAVCGAATAGVVLVGWTQLPGTGPAPVGGPDAVVTYAVPQLPVAAGVPGAATRPDLVGTDPLLRHFTVDTSAWPVGEAVYLSTDGAETIQAGGLTVTVSRERAKAQATLDRPETVTGPPGSATPTTRGTTTTSPTTVAGRSATLVTVTNASGRYPFWGLLWQPVDGLWVGMLTQTKTGQAELWSDVAALRLDGGYRCVVPFRLTDPSYGARVLSCVAGVPGPGLPYAYASIELGDGGARRATVSVGQTSQPADPTSPAQDVAVAGRSARWWPYPSSGVLIADDVDGLPVEVRVEGGWVEADAIRILAGLRVTPFLTDASSWPTQPLATAG